MPAKKRIRIESNLEQDGTLRLGQFLRVDLEREGLLETRCFLMHQGVFYPEPWRDWNEESKLVLYPEAPGRYALLLEWRSARGSRGWEEISFRVTSSVKAPPIPHQMRLPGGMPIWAPTAWDAAVSTEGEKTSIERLRSLVGRPTGMSERKMLAVLDRFLKPGSTVYDVGANMGVYALPMARKVGREGRIYCLEPNPVCVHFLTGNVAANRLRNVDILPVALAQEDGRTRFKLSYGNSNLGLLAGSGFFSGKPGYEIEVPCYAFDSLLDTFPLRAPDLMKIDIEGLEFSMLSGARKQLEAHRPVLIVEFHHEGYTRLSLELLDGLGYRYLDPRDGETIRSSTAILEGYAASVFQLVALPEASVVGSPSGD